jgi:hypothetical protein
MKIKEIRRAMGMQHDTRERTEISVIHDTSDPRTLAPVIVKSVVFYLLSSIMLSFLTHNVYY